MPLLIEAEVTKAGCHSCHPPGHQSTPLVPPGRVARQSVTLPPGQATQRPSAGRQGVSMGPVTSKVPFQASWLNVPRGDRVAALSAEPDPARRGYQPRHGPRSHATPPAMVNAGHQEEEVEVDDVPPVLWWHTSGGRGRTQQRQQRQQRHRRQRYFNRDDKQGRQERKKDLREQDPCGSPQCGQPGEARWRCHNWRSQQQQQRAKPLRRDQAGGQHKMPFWNVRKHCRVTTLHRPAAMLREASTRLRPMNMAGYCLPGMCAPHNTSQYIMDQHTYTWRNEEEEAAAKSGESGNYSSVGEDFLLTVPLPSTAQEDEGILTEVEEESTQPAHRG